MVRYMLQGIRTFAAVRSTRPAIVIYTNPPFIVGFLLLALRPHYGFALWSDVHSGAFNDPRWRRFGRANNWILRRGDGVILATDVLKRRLDARCREVAVVGMPATVDRGPASFCSPYLVAALSYSFDEPIDELVEALRCAPDVRVFLPGHAPKGIRQGAPPNAIFTGWLTRGSYERLLARSAGLICLTTREETMQMGAYEGAEHGLPMLLSDTDALRGFFPQGALFVADHQPATLANALAELGKRRELRRGAENMRRLLLDLSERETMGLRSAMGLD